MTGLIDVIAPEMKEEIGGDIQAELANTKLYILKVVDNKLSVGKDEGSENSWANVADKHVQAKLGLVSSEVESVQKAIQDSRDAVREEQDRESRRNNIVFYRAPESDANTAAERNVADKDFCTQLLFGLNAGVAEEDIRISDSVGEESVIRTLAVPALYTFYDR